MSPVSRLRALFRHRAVRYASLVPTIAIAILAAVIVASLTIDLGPRVHGIAEREGSKRIDRPLHIGRLSIRLLTGRVIVEDVLIEGKHPGDRPFLTAKQMSVSLDWSAVLQRRPEFI